LKKDIIIFAILTLAATLILFIVGQSGIDIQLHDTYIELDKISLVVLIIGPLTFLAFLLLALTRKFMTTWTNTGLIIGLCMVSLIFFRTALFQSSYRDHMRDNFELSVLPLPTADRERFVNEMNNRIMLTWGLFGICIAGVGLTGFWTYKLLTNEK